MGLSFRTTAGGRFDLVGAAGALQGVTAGVRIGPDGRQWLPERWVAVGDGASAAGVAAGPAAAGATPTAGVAVEAELPQGLRLTLRAETAPVGDGTLLHLGLRNDGDQPVPVVRLEPLLADAQSELRLAGSGGAWRVYKQGWQSWSFVGLRGLDEKDVAPRFFLTRPAHADPSWAPAVGRGHFQSESMLMLGTGDGGPVLLAGFAKGDRQLGRLELRADATGRKARAAAEEAGRGPAAESLRPEGGPSRVPLRSLAAWCETDGCLLLPGETLAAEPLLVAIEPERAALDGYAESCGQLMHARVPERSPAVWCSWYYHFTRVQEADLLVAAEGLKALRHTHPVDVIQLDDGYQTAVGDWLSVNEKFPHGLPWLAEQIRAAGFTPGLWLAPFIALRKSRLYREHPDWFVQDDTGRPADCGWNPAWGDRYGALDTTHPKVAQWLTDLIQSLVGAGFRYLKLDFLYGAAVKGVRHDRSVTRAAALRRGLEVIRRAAGEDVFLLGCGSPMLPAVGVVDGMRVGPDVAPSWGFRFLGLPILPQEPGTAAAKNALRVALNRQWMHRRLWLNDPDSLILRAQETGLTRAEAEALVSVGGLSDGILSFSDPPARLDAERLEWLRRVLPTTPTGGGFQPVTLLGDEFPFLSTLRHGDWTVVLAVNAGAAPRPLQLHWAQLGLQPGGQYHLFDCWSGEYLGRTDDGESVDVGQVPVHGSRVLALRPAGTAPCVVGTSLRLAPPAAVISEAWDGHTLKVTLAEGISGPGQLIVAAPAGCGEIDVAVEGARVSAICRKGPDSWIVALR